MMPDEFRWSAFDPNHWDHYYHAGQQVRFYRQLPCRLGGSAIEEPDLRWIDSFFLFLQRLTNS